MLINHTFKPIPHSWQIFWLAMHHDKVLQIDICTLVGGHNFRSHQAGQMCALKKTDDFNEMNLMNDLGVRHSSSQIFRQFIGNADENAT